MDRPEDGGEHVWYAYIEPNPPSEWFNSKTYVDTFNMAAMSRFMEVTHGVYKEAFSQDFGTTIPSIFTDEPQFSHKTQLIGVLGDQVVFLPWTMDLRESFQRCYGHDIKLTISGITWGMPGQLVSCTRYRYHDDVFERFVEAFMDQLSAWCKGNGIFLTGHMTEEPNLSSQTAALGEAMRCYRNLDLPGIDMLCDRTEYNTAKQASSVARQNGALGVMSEIYGVTNWAFTFADHKRSGDWQAALGITWRVHHLTWVRMAGEAKRDYPACIGYQSPWFKEYHYIEDHFARLNVALTSGCPVAWVAVTHPMESFWLCFGPIQGGGAEQEFREQAFKDLTDWLLFGLIDFDFISESLLPTQCTNDGGAQLHVGKYKYDVVILPNMRTIRSSTLDILEQFGKNGGRIIIAGEKPSLVDASPIKATSIHKLTSAAQIPWTKYHILQTVEGFQDVHVTNTTSGRQTTSLLYQLRKEHDSRILFICNTDRKQSVTTEVSIRGIWTARLLDTLTGKICLVESTVHNVWTSLRNSFEACGSLLLFLMPRELPSTGFGLRDRRNEYKFLCKVSLRGATLSEPNVLLLDRAEYKLYDGPWCEAEEILRIDNLIREELNLPRKLDANRQPWSIEKNKRKTVANLALRFKFESDIDLSKPAWLALEDASTIDMVFNGSTVTYDELKSDWWVDEDIRTVELPSGAIKRGINELLLSYDFSLLTNLERIYILGDFGVKVHGESSIPTDLDVSNLKFGDWTTQGLPFYAGNVTYQFTFYLSPENFVDESILVQNGTISQSRSKQRIALEVPSFTGPLLAVDRNGQRAGRSAFEPKILELGELGELEQGEHELSITSFGNRFNAFGTVHLPKGVTSWCGPNGDGKMSIGLKQWGSCGHQR